MIGANRNGIQSIVLKPRYLKISIGNRKNMKYNVSIVMRKIQDPKPPTIPTKIASELSRISGETVNLFCLIRVLMDLFIFE